MRVAPVVATANMAPALQQPLASKKLMQQPIRVVWSMAMRVVP